MNNWILVIILIILALISYWFFNLNKSNQELSEDKKIIKNAIKAHGGKTYNTAHFSYDFRDRSYSFKHNNGAFEYTRTTSQGDSTILDLVTNDGFKRFINDIEQNLSAEDAAKYSGSVVSVNYFALLPYKLEDEAVVSENMAAIKIKEKEYHTIKIHFNAENGGEDHEDIYYYWINKETNFVDYLAYSFPTKDGLGIRFRSAYNGRTVGNIRFQDYINYKAANGTDLEQLPKMFEKEQLQKLSVIELKHVKKLN